MGHKAGALRQLGQMGGGGAGISIGIGTSLLFIQTIDYHNMSIMQKKSIQGCSIIFNLTVLIVVYFIVSELFCGNSIEERIKKLPQGINFTEVNFGIISKEKVSSSYTRIDYPCQVRLCLNPVFLNQIKNEFNSKGDGFKIDQIIVTNNGIKWHYESYIPFGLLDPCFPCNIYDPFNTAEQSPKMDLVKGNIKSYLYTVKIVHSGEEVKYFSGFKSDL
ncbi:MAG: hypothetical protein ACKVU0_03200 [Saprospiraceae bacterium]